MGLHNNVLATIQNYALSGRIFINQAALLTEVHKRFQPCAELEHHTCPDRPPLRHRRPAVPRTLKKACRVLSRPMSVVNMLRWMSGLPPSSSAMPSCTASVKISWLAAERVTSSITRVLAPSRSRWHCTSDMVIPARGSSVPAKQVSSDQVRSSRPAAAASLENRSAGSSKVRSGKVIRPAAAASLRNRTPQVRSGHPGPRPVAASLENRTAGSRQPSGGTAFHSILVPVSCNIPESPVSPPPPH